MPVEGRTAEPFGIVVKGEETLPLITNKNQLYALKFRFNTQLQTVTMTCSPNKDTSFTLDQRGNITYYHFKSGNHYISIYYDTDGYPTEYTATYKDYFSTHDATGALTNKVPETLRIKAKSLFYKDVNSRGAVLLLPARNGIINR